MYKIVLFFFLLSCANTNKQSQRNSVIDLSEEIFQDLPSAGNDIIVLSPSIPVPPKPSEIFLPEIHYNDIDDTANDCSDVLMSPAINRGSTVMLIGDSLAVGMSYEFKRLAKKAGYRAVTHAITGSTTLQWLSLIKHDLKVNKPSLVVVSLGTNDAAAPAILSNHPELFKEFVKIIDKTSAFLVWIGPPAISIHRVPKLNVARKLIKQVAPIYFSSENLKIHFTDGYHTDPAGYKKWIQEVWQSMVEEMIVHEPE